MFGKKKPVNMNANEANAILGVLILKGLASEYGKSIFVDLQTNGQPEECTLIDSKYDGTKFYTNSPRRPWSVCTANDYRSEAEQKIVDEVNAELEDLYKKLRG